MFPSSSVTASIASAVFAAHATHAAGHAEPLNLKASLDALSSHFGSPVIVDGLPGSPIRPLGEESTLDTPDNLTHLIFYPSDQADHMSLMTHLVRDGQQMLIFEVILPVDDNLLFRAAATAALALRHGNQDALVASDADTFALRRTIERKLHPPLNRSVSMDSIAPTAADERAATIENLRAAAHTLFQRLRPPPPYGQRPSVVERIRYENGMRQLRPSPASPAAPAAMFLPNKAAKRPFPF
jgi:hypothetical protein